MYNYVYVGSANMKLDFEVECLLVNNDSKSYIEITFSNDGEEIFSYSYEVGKDEKFQARKCIDNLQIYLNENNLVYDKDDLDFIKDEVAEKVSDCIKDNSAPEKEFFNKNATIDALSNNDCKFSYNCINILLDRIRNGEVSLIPDGKSAPRTFDFINDDNDRCFGYIETIYVYSSNDLNLINETDFGKHSFICGFKDEKSKKIIIITLGYMNISNRTPELKYYQFENFQSIGAKNGTVYLFDMDEAEVTAETDCDFANILMPYHDYYSLCLQDLESKNDNQKMTIALDFLHENYVEIDNLTIDKGSSIIPIKGKTYKFKEVQIDCFINNKIEQYPFYGGEIYLLNKEDEEEIYSQLTAQNINIPDDIAFVRFNYSELGDKDQSIIKSLIASGEYDKIQIRYNITGEIIRIKRVVEGIEKCLLGAVKNSQLVELICSNRTNDILSDLIKSHKYIPNKKYISELKSKYWALRENEEQITTIDKIVQMECNKTDLMLVQGPPGTGKTELILSLIKELYQLNYKVLVTSNVQVACDNIVDRLKNYRNIAIKRYSTIKGEKYEREILENEQKYIKNEVLAGFSLTLDNGKVVNLVLDGRDSFNKILVVKNEYVNKVLLIESEKQKYIDFLKEYNSLTAEKDEKNNLLLELSEKIKLLEAEYDKNIDNIKNSELEISKLIELNKERLIKINEQKEKINLYTSKKEQLELKMNSLFKIKEKASLNKNEIEDNSIECNNLFDSKNEKLKNQTEALVSLNSISRDSIIKQLSHYISRECFDNNGSVSANILNIILSDFIPIIDSGKFIKNILFKDAKFLQNNKNLSLSNFDSIYFKLKNNEAYKMIFDKEVFSWLDDIKCYYSISPYKKLIFSIFPFIKINGKSYQSYANKVTLFNDELKRIYYSFDNIIESTIDSNYIEKKMKEKKGIIKDSITQLNNDTKALNQQINKLKVAVTDVDKKLFVITNDIDDSKKELDKINKLLEKLIEKYDSDFLTYSSAMPKEKQIIETIETLKKKNIDVYKNLSNLNKTNDTEKKLYNELDISINKYYEENQELIEDFEIFMQSKEVAKIRYQKYIDSIQAVIDSFNNRVQSFVNAGWTKSDAENILFNYALELEKISDIEINKNKEELRYFINGHGTAFREMFELNDTGKGSIISMTTNQVASLLKNTTDNELTFDYAIIDEASKCTFEDIVISLPRIKHLVLIGDFMQLDKLYKNFNQIDLKYQNTLSYSLWDSLNSSTFYQCLKFAVDYNNKNQLNSFDNNRMVSVMKKQYRMNKGIFNIVKPIYEIHKEFELIDQKQSTYNDLLCIQIDGEEVQDDNKSSSNPKEGLAIVTILKEISEHRDLYPGIKTIGVITGYKAQENFIRKNLKKEKKISGLEIGTYDRFQGREYDLVLMSLVRTENLGFNSNLRRMNVAISRAKNHLIILGNFDKLLNVSRKIYYYNDDNFQTNKEEIEFVTKKMIPCLYNLKKKYPSDDSMKNAVIKFLKEEENE